MERTADPDDRARDLIHSDTPLLAKGEDEYWPNELARDDAFGCASRVAFGDWLFREENGGSDADLTWYRVENYGVFHCFALVGEASERVELGSAERRPSFFVKLGMAQSRDGGAVEAWALQMGARPGSDYLLFSREPSEQTVKSFSVLQSKCPADRVRSGGALSILRTDYCAINSRADLVRLAQRMGRLPPRGTLTLED
ncbi:MAG: hypothetical protein AB7M12_10700 [Hyphomonadaceae bacterium]